MSSQGRTDCSGKSLSPAYPIKKNGEKKFITYNRDLTVEKGRASEGGGVLAPVVSVVLVSEGGGGRVPVGGVRCSVVPEPSRRTPDLLDFSKHGGTTVHDLHPPLLPYQGRPPQASQSGRAVRLC